MHLLLKGAGDLALAAHIPTTDGTPLCRIHIKLTDWHLREMDAATVLICYHCKRAQAKAVLACERTV